MLSENNIKNIIVKNDSVKSRIIILIISLIALAIFYGCGSHSSNPFFVSGPSEIVVSSREVEIDEHGRLPSITFPSGVKIEASEENTLIPGIKVIITELEKTSRDIDYFTNSSRSYIYRVVAFQSISDSKTYVTTLEKPVKVTITVDKNTQGIVLAGINESESEPWRFFNLSNTSEVLENMAGMRSAKAKSNEYTFDIFRLGTQLAVIFYDSKNSNKFPETFISSISASSTANILVKNGKYSDDLTLKCFLTGINLSSMKPSDFIAKITYRNNISSNSLIKVNGINVNQSSASDNSVPGYGYVHSFIVDSLSDSYLMSNNGEFSFILNIKGLEVQNFPSGFLIEFYNKVDPEKIIPYKYTDFYTLNKVESINISLISNDGNLADKAKNLYILNPTFTITSDYEFNDSEKAKIAKAISVSNVDSKKISKTWNDKNLTLSFKENLQQNTNYTISIGKVDNKEGFVINTFEDFNFTTKPELYNIEYNYNGGKAAFPNPEAYDVTSAEFTLNNPTKEGYDFIGWSGTGLKGKNNLAVTIKQGSKGNRSYTANYSPTQYTITYYLNGGNITIPNPESYDITSSTIQLNNPSRPYYKFIGWTNEDINTPRAVVTIEQGSTGDKSYTANWIENPTNTYSLTLSKGIGIDEVIGSGLYASESTVNATCTMLAGYEFAFWTGNVTESTFSMPYYDVVMQANAQLINYSITYKLNGGKVDTKNPTSYNINSDNLPLINPTRLGYTFLGWTGTDLDIASKTFFIPHGSIGNREYTANWSLNTYTITCNIGEGNVATPNPTTYDVASANITLTNPVPTKDYYLFKGWNGTGLEGSENLVVTIPKGSVGDRVYTANYAPEVFPITYTYEGEMAENPDSYDTTTLAFILNNPTKANFDFLGWTGTGIPAGTASLTVIIPKGSNGARSYTASFTERFTIGYTLNGGTLVAANPDSYNKYSDAIILNNPTKADCEFLGWEGSNIPPGTASLTVVIPKGSTGNRTYTASFTQRFSIAYTLNGGSVAVANPTEYDSNSDAIALNNPTRSGYDFLGWEGTGITPGTASLSVIIPKGSNGNRRYTASFTERFTIAYTLNGGTLAAANLVSYNKYSANILLNNPTKSGSDFLGWTGTGITPGTASNTVIIYKGSTGNREYVASFTPRYSISYNLVNGTVAATNPTSYNKYTPTIALNNPTKSGHDFIGWEGTGITPGTASMTVIIPKGSEDDRIYTASFTPRFTIEYNLSNGSLAAANPVSYNKYSANIMLNNPTKSGYDFLGWTGTDIPPGTASKSVVIYNGSEGDREYVASFTEKYTITYNLNGGTSSNPLSYNKYTNSFALTTPTRTGDTSSDFYVFVGWTGTDIASATKSVTITQGSTGNREFTAHWLEGKSFELSPGINLKMIKCPAGAFIMGSPEGELDKSVNESQHHVTLTQDFYIGIYEVTQIQYFTAMNTNPSNFKDGLANEEPTTYANHPVEKVKWSDAKNFCAWLNTNITSGVPANYHFDLPTEAQWEYACRAGTTTSLNNGTNVTYSTGFDPNLIEVAWCKTNSSTSTQPVGGKKPNNWGLYDMHGNVNEWCLDSREEDWSIDYQDDPVTDPYYTTGPERIIRGGCYNSGENKRYRSAARDGKGYNNSYSNVGFRVVITHD